MRRSAQLALLAFVAALLLRLLNAGTAFVDGVPRFSPLDELYHAKRIAVSALHFPEVLSFDPDRGTHGAWCPWPPLYDLAAGGYARLLGATTWSGVIFRVVWLPPLLFALFVAAATWFVTRARSALAGALTGLALASSPFLVDLSWIGAIDHHFLEPPLTFAIAFATIRLFRAERDALRDSTSGGVLLGAAMIAAMFVQPALLLACALAFVLLFFAPLLVSTVDDLPRTAVARGGALAFGLLTAAVAIYAATRPPGYPSSPWFLGWPHAGIFAGATAALLLRARRAPLLLALAAGGAVTLAVPAAASAILGGSHFLAGDPWLRTISEFRPVLTEAPVDLLSDVVLLSGGLILVWPLAARAWRTRNAADGAIALFAIVYLLLELSSRRFRPLGITFLALAGAVEAGHLASSRRKPLALAAILLVALPPPIQLLLWLQQPNPPILESQMPWLRAAGFFQRQSAGGRVLAPWSPGHLLDVIGQRPVILDNFGSMPDPVDFERANDAFLQKDEAALARYCDANHIRWIVFPNPLFELPSSTAVLGIDPTHYIELTHELTNDPQVTRVHRLAQATCWWRAYFGRGAARPMQGMFGAPLTRFRLVYADPQPAWHGTNVNNGPALEIWERR